MNVEPDRARWFDALGVCHCGKPASGTLRGPADEAIQVCCEWCARKRIAKAERNRGLEAAEPPSQREPQWWERLPANVTQAAKCPHGHVDMDDCPDCRQ
jgi:hypothetical protein